MSNKKRESSPGITWASTTFRDAGLASWTYGGIRPWLNIAINIFKLHWQQKWCRNSKDPKKKESLHLSGPPLLPPGHVRRQPKKVWQSTQYLVVNNAMMFSSDNIRFTSKKNCWTEWMLWWRGHRPPWQRREWSSFKQQEVITDVSSVFHSWYPNLYAERHCWVCSPGEKIF